MSSSGRPPLVAVTRPLTTIGIGGGGGGAGAGVGARPLTTIGIGGAEAAQAPAWAWELEQEAVWVPTVPASETFLRMPSRAGRTAQ